MPLRYPTYLIQMTNDDFPVFPDNVCRWPLGCVSPKGKLCVMAEAKFPFRGYSF
jgi:hypothetical protein